jgi:recombination protein U
MNYPGGVKKEITQNKDIKKISHKNRGMTLEADLNISNEYYREVDKAYIYKKPTPIKIVNVDFPSKNKAVIKEAYFSTPSTTDYNGLYKGKYIDFEAKETNVTTSFSLNNVHPHQIKHLEEITKHGGIGFFIIYFKKLDEVYLLPFEVIKEFWDKRNTERKSIPYQVFLERAHKIKISYMPMINYLKVLDEVYF